MSDNANKKETILTYVSDVHALVEHGLRAIERQRENLKDVSHKAVPPALAEALRVLHRQKLEIESRLETLGGKATGPVKDAVSAVAGVAAGIINAVRPSESVKSLRDDATYFSGLGVAYLLLYTTAVGFDDSETAKLAERGYRDAAKTIMHLDHVLPAVTVEELREHNPSVRNSAEQVRTMVSQAWDRSQSLSA
ncbi:MAG: hypothetical protein H7Z43_09085 [Clostridia bacterium]|nr:hypothetical protein [Deltaproteobacteria bacterium]